MDAMASQFSSVSIVDSAVCSGADQRIYQSSASLAFVRGIHRWPVDSPHKGPVMRTKFPFDNVIMIRLMPSESVYTFYNNHQVNIVSQLYKRANYKSKYVVLNPAEFNANAGLCHCYVFQR